MFRLTYGNLALLLFLLMGGVYIVVEIRIKQMKKEIELVLSEYVQIKDDKIKGLLKEMIKDFQAVFNDFKVVSTELSERIEFVREVTGETFTDLGSYLKGLEQRLLDMEELNGRDNQENT